MTARQIFEATLIELSKVNAPALKLYEFNYLFNKAINQYVNKVYNTYDINQQTTDDLRVLKATAFLTPELVSNNSNKIQQSLLSASFEVALPSDYLHMLNCVCIYEIKKTISCYDAGSYVEIPAIRLTADSWSQIITDVYNRPTPMRPYYYIHNINKQNELPTDIYNASTNEGTDQYLSSTAQYIVNPFHLKFKTSGDNTAVPLSNVDFLYEELSRVLEEDTNPMLLKEMYPIKYATQNKHLYFDIDGTAHYMWVNVNDLNDIKLLSTGDNPQNPGNSQGLSNQYISLQLIKIEESNTEFPRTTSLKLPINGNGSVQTSLVQKEAYVRHSNPTKVRCEIRYGKDFSVYKLAQVAVDYVKSPQHIRLTQEQIDLTEDTSQIMEFPDYVNQEIINELVHLVMERENNPRLSNHLQMTQTIARPTQQQPQQTT